MQAITAFVLTIEGEDHSRCRHARQELARLGLKAIFVQGLKVGDSRLQSLYSRWRNILLFKRSLSEGEVAAYAGHRLIWQAIDARKMDTALVFEDDFCVLDDKAFRTALDDCMTFRSRWDIVKFFDYRPKRVIAQQKLAGTELVAYKYPASGAVSYLITREAAQALLKRKHVFRPVDEDFSHMWEFNIRIWSVSPNLVDEISHELGGSTLERGRVVQKRQARLIRSVWGNLIQGVKLYRSYSYRSVMTDAATLNEKG